MTPAFRMHVKAHGTVAKIFRALQDATKDQVFIVNIIYLAEQFLVTMPHYFIELRNVYSYRYVCSKSRSFEYGFRP